MDTNYLKGEYQIDDRSSLPSRAAGLHRPTAIKPFGKLDQSNE